MSEKKDQVAQIGVRGGGGLGDSDNARKKTLFSIEAVPYSPADGKFLWT